ncbi:hypothetical protein C8Q76DRAFT_690627 [Earliella scabrosa]|nr:hypothetical protein C8Q76DRAFT_690627 [Earliella scabrosa]
MTLAVHSLYLYAKIVATNYCTLASTDHIRGLTVGTTALYVYDCMITLDREIDLIWMSPRRSSATYLFLSLRYSVLFANIYNLSAFIHMSDEFLLPAVFSGLRAYALSRNRLISIMIFVLCLAPFGSTLYHYKFGFSGIVVSGFGCASMYEKPGMQEFFRNLLTWYCLYRKGLLRSQTTVRLAFPKVLIRNGTLYFGITSSLISRFLLDLQAAYRGKTEWDSAGDLSMTASQSALVFERVLAPLAHTSFEDSEEEGSYEPSENEFSEETGASVLTLGHSAHGPDEIAGTLAEEGTHPPDVIIEVPGTSTESVSRRSIGAYRDFGSDSTGQPGVSIRTFAHSKASRPASAERLHRAFFRTAIESVGLCSVSKKDILMNAQGLASLADVAAQYLSLSEIFVLWVSETNSYGRVASAAFLVYEYLITLEREVELFWKGGSTSATALFAVNSALEVSSLSYSSVAGHLALMGTYSFRGYALSRSWTLAILVFVLSISTSVVNISLYPFGFTGYFDPVFGCTVINPISFSLSRKCMLTTWEQVVIACRTCFILADMLLIAITWTTISRKDIFESVSRRATTSLAGVLLRNGMIQYLVLVHVALQSLSYGYVTVFIEA